MLHGIGEGVLAVDAGGRVSVCNAEAARLLGADAGARRRRSPTLDLPPRLRAAIGRRAVGRQRDRRGRRPGAGGQRRAVRRDGRDLGSVLTLRDRTDLEN